MLFHAIYLDITTKHVIKTTTHRISTQSEMCYCQGGDQSSPLIGTSTGLFPDGKFCQPSSRRCIVLQMSLFFKQNTWVHFQCYVCLIYLNSVEFPLLELGTFSTFSENIKNFLIQLIYLLLTFQYNHNL